MAIEHLYILDQVSAASQYGIGTYIRQLISIWNEGINRKLTIVKMDASLENIEEFQCEGIRYLHLPLEDDECINHDDFYKALAEAFITCMDNSEKNIIHINYFHQYSLVERIRFLMPTIYTVMTIHYFDWGMLSSETDIKTILNKPKNERTKKETAIYHAFIGNGSVLKKVDRIICLSKYTKDILCQMYHIDSSKVEFICNTLPDEYDCLTLEQKILEKSRSGIAINKRIFIFVGRLDYNKGGLYLVRAFRKLLSIINDAHLIIVGDGCMDVLKEETEDIISHITFTGLIPKEKVYSLYRIADIGILPSLYEQCSYVIIEMMMHGLPIIATDSSGLNEMIDEGDGGVKISTKKFDNNRFVDDLKEAMNTMLTIPNSKLDAMGKYNRESYLNKYDFNLSKIAINKVWSFCNYKC